MNSLHVSHHPCAPAEGENYGGGDSGTTGRFSEAKQSIARGARNATQQIKSAASETASRARSEAERMMTDKRDEAANRIGRYSSAIHESARSLENEDPNIAWFTHQAADRLDRVAEYVRSCNYSSVCHDVEDVARRHPALFFGGMFALGLVAGNMMKASRRSEWDDTGSYGSDEQTDWSPAANAPLQNTGSADELPTNTPATGF